MEPAPPEAPTTAIPRLSRREVEASVAAVFGVVGAALRDLPADPPTAVNPATLVEEEVFDTLAASKQPSEVFVEGLEALATEVGRDFAADAPRVARLAGCAPAGTGLDAACLGRLIDAVALRLWRRPASAEERDALVALVTPLSQGAGAAAHSVAVRAAVSALIQSPEFVYRVELGAPTRPGLVELSDRELLGRLAAFLWGASPSPELLARTAPLDAAALPAVVDAMLDDPRAAEQMRTFHSLWLRYPNLLITDAALATDMRAETEALLSRALTPGKPWTTLFDSTQTFVTPRLATHYGLPVPSTPAWVSVENPRAGVLSHGSFLSLSATRVNDTLPSRRGAMLARRVLCLTILPPPKDVNVDNGVAVAPGACKRAAYTAHAGGGCAGCHSIIDGLGFGFEALDGQGRVRAVETDNASCAIDGAGSWGGKPFSGPRALVEGSADTITQCAVDQLARFAFRGRTLSSAALARFVGAFTAAGYDFKALLRAIALDPRFRQRSDEGSPP